MSQRGLGGRSLKALASHGCLPAVSVGVAAAFSTVAVSITVPFSVTLALVFPCALAVPLAASLGFLLALPIHSVALLQLLMPSTLFARRI